jgi:hypothetical protein
MLSLVKVGFWGLPTKEADYAYKQRGRKLNHCMALIGVLPAKGCKGGGESYDLYCDGSMNRSPVLATQAGLLNYKRSALLIPAVVTKAGQAL